MHIHTNIPVSSTIIKLFMLKVLMNKTTTTTTKNSAFQYQAGSPGFNQTQNLLGHW